MTASERFGPRCRRLTLERTTSGAVDHACKSNPSFASEKAVTLSDRAAVSLQVVTRLRKRMGCAIENNDTFFLLPREMIVEYVEAVMPIWQRKLFGALSRNMSYAPNYFFIPYTQIVDFTWMMKA